jgi:ketosteroid isomerase-like protein
MSFDNVDKLNREFERGYNNGQVKEAVTTYANDARLFATDKKIYEGLSQIEKYYSNEIAVGNSKVELHTGQVIQCGSDYLVETRFVFNFRNFPYRFLFY